MGKYGKMLFAALFLAVLLCGCSKEPITGTVTAFEAGILTVQTEGGKTYDFVVEPLNTTIFNIAGEGNAAFLEDAPDHRVQVNYSKKDGKLLAEHIFVNARLHRGEIHLADGTPIDVWKYAGRNEYCLENGTALLMEDNTGGPENTHPWNELLYNEDFPEPAQKGILDYYREMGQRYDIPTLLEEAYRVYGFVEEYNTQVVSQYVGIEAYNERIICCQMNLTIPQERTNGYADYFSEGTVFDRETGAVIPNYDLFAVTPEELETCLLNQLDHDGTLDRENIQLNLKPEQIVMRRDGGIDFFLVDRVDNGVRSMLQMGLSPEQAREILQPWAMVEPAGMRS